MVYLFLSGTDIPLSLTEWLSLRYAIAISSFQQGFPPEGDHRNEAFFSKPPGTCLPNTKCFNLLGAGWRYRIYNNSIDPQPWRQHYDVVKSNGFDLSNRFMPSRIGSSYFAGLRLYSATCSVLEG